MSSWQRVSVAVAASGWHLASQLLPVLAVEDPTAEQASRWLQVLAAYPVAVAAETA